MATAFRQGLNEAGYVEGHNVTIEYRWAENQYGRLPALAADLVDRRVAVIFANSPSVTAAKAATSAVPIVFLSGDDPVQRGLVASFNRPGGNVTGVTILSFELAAKRLELLHELIPNAKTIAVLINSDFGPSGRFHADVEAAAPVLGMSIAPLQTNNEREIDSAFVVCLQWRDGHPEYGCRRFDIGVETPGGAEIRVDEYSDGFRIRDQLVQKFESLRSQFEGKNSHSGDISTRSVETGNQPALNRIIAAQKNDRYRAGCGLGRGDRRAVRENHGHPTVDQVRRKCRQATILVFRPAIFDRYVMTLDIAGLVEALPERGRHRRVPIGGMRCSEIRPQAQSSAANDRSAATPPPRRREAQ